MVTLLFRKSRRKNKSLINFATSPDILVAKGKTLVANVTVLVAISSPEVTKIIKLNPPLLCLLPYYIIFLNQDWL